MAGTKTRYTSIDIIKGIAICMVIAVHSGQRINNLPHLFDFLMFGQMGCQLFFVASGFTSAMSLCKCKDKALFWRKRFSSIAPGFYLMILVTHLLNLILSRWSISIGFANNMDPVAVILNMVFLQGIFPFCNNNVMAGGWFIGTTALLYMIAPFLYKLLTRMKHSNLIPMISSVITLVIAVTLSNLLHDKTLADNNSFFYFSALTQLPCFILGMFLYIENDHQLLEEKESAGVFHLLLLSIVFLIVTAFLFFFDLSKVIGSFGSYRFLLCVTTMGYAGYYLLKYLRITGANSKVLEVLGQKSYFMYLTHAFFVWTLPIVLEEIFDVQRFVSPELMYILLLPIMLGGTFVSAIVLERICRPVTGWIMPNAN